MCTFGLMIAVVLCEMTTEQFKRTQIMRGKGKLPIADYTPGTTSKAIIHVCKEVKE